MPTRNFKLLLTSLTRRNALALVLTLAVGVALTACKKNVAEEASDSDANGYLCLDCGARLYTDRSVFIGPKCPKCQKDLLVEVVGYWCEKDQHLTIRSRAGDRLGSPVCDKCKAPVNAMRLPRQKDLIAWGAAKTDG